MGRLARGAAAILPTAAAIAAFATIYGFVRAALACHSVSAREGWLGALPVERAVRERGAAALALGLGAACSVALFGAMAAAGGPDALPTAAATIALGLVASLVAWGATLRLRSVRGRDPEARPSMRRVPRLAFAPSWPRSPAVPHLALWQRIRTASRWRSAGRAWQIGALALALPRNTAVLHGVVLLVVVAAALWWLTMVAASLRVHAEARSLLEPLPQDRRTLARSALRYPVIGSVFAAGIILLASATAWGSM